ncbi:MAG: nitric-oxide reductase large subunit [Acidobacteriota bacterium]
MSLSRLRLFAGICFVIAMGGLLFGGWQTLGRMAPYPGRVVDESGAVLMTREEILAGQDVYQRYGLMDHGSVWGHGSQRGMEFSAVTLHRWGELVRDALALERFGRPFDELGEADRRAVEAATAVEMKANRYDASTDTLTLTAAQAAALPALFAWWDDVFAHGEPDYGFLPDTIPAPDQRRAIGRFFVWTAWAAVADRPGSDASYTSNWPPDPLVGNQPSASTYIWTLGGVLALFLVLGVFVYYVHAWELWYGPAAGVPLARKLIDMPLTPSQAAAAKFFLVVSLLFLLQTTFGGLLAHYTVHPGSFWVEGIAGFIPYSWAKSWHLQLAIFWIATTWVASAIYLAPVIGGREPARQRTLVQLLFAAILLVAVGSLAGQVLGIKGQLGDMWFWFGHQGWEYLELGRFWQILLFVGLVAWLGIVYRTVAHLFRSASSDYRALIKFYVFSAILVVAFFAFGLFYGRGTHITLADYWRWFVVHIWVESIFEFFGVAVISLLLVAMGLASARAALRVAYFTAGITFLSGILGTAHHYFWYGGPSYWLAVGSVFSSMEPVPLFGLVVRGMMEYRSIRQEGHDFPYRWPMYFLVASSFWNFLGAGVFGFLINLPIVNYFEHGTYLTMNHGHAALFGTYGMLSIALLLFSWRGLVDKGAWSDRLLKVSFWGLNVGLFLMTLGTLFPVGIFQTWVAFRDGLWAARDAAFFDHPFVQLVGTIRALPDTVIILFGVLPLAVFLFGTYRHLKPSLIREGESVWERLGFDPESTS